MSWEKLTLSPPREGNGGTMDPDLPHVYVSTENYSVLENLLNRRNRPYTEWKPVVEKMLRDDFNVDTNLVKVSWSQKAGCMMCPCSPGFIIKPRYTIMNTCYNAPGYDKIGACRVEIEKIGYHKSMWLTVRWIEPQVEVESELKNKNVVFTGAMALPRKDLMAMAKSAGVNVQNAVNQDTNFLVLATGINPSGPISSTKHRKARQLGIAIISEDDFMEKVN